MQQYYHKEKNVKYPSINKIVKNFYISRLIMGVVLIISTAALRLWLSNTTLNQDGIHIYLTIPCIILMIIIGVIFIIQPLMRLLLHKDDKYIEELTQKYNISQAEIGREYITADKNGSLRVHNTFTFIKTTSRIHIIPNREIVWVYGLCTTQTTTIVSREGIRQEEISRRQKYSLVIKTMNCKRYMTTFYQECRLNAFIKQYTEHPHIIIGYDDYYKKLYNHHFDEFLQLQYDAYSGPQLIKR